MGWSNSGWRSDQGGWYKNAAGAPASFTTWDPSAKGPDITLSTDKLTATHSASGFEVVRAIASASAGKKYHEVNVAANTTYASPGMANASAPLNAFLGGDNNGITWLSSGIVWLNLVQTPIQTWAVGNTLGIAVDLTNSRIWFRTNAGSWNNNGSADPATNVGGIDISTMATGPYFPAAMENNSLDSLTANFGATAYAQTVPSGFGNW